MPRADEPIIVPIEADFSGFSSAMTDLQKETKYFGSVFSGTISSAIRKGKSFEETLKSLALRLSNVALEAGLKPLENLASSFFGQVTSGIGSAVGNLFGNLGGGGIVPFAKGGVISSPTYFSAGSALGVMGEAGSEAIMPLARGPDGRLGVRTQGSSATPVNVTFNVSTPDVQGFKKSEGQLSAMLARTVSRGRRGL